MAVDYLTEARRHLITTFLQTEIMGRERLNQYITDAAIIVDLGEGKELFRLNRKRLLEESDLLKSELSPTPTIDNIRNPVHRLKTAHNDAKDVNVLAVLRSYLENNPITITQPDEIHTITEVLSRGFQVYKFAEDF